MNVLWLTYAVKTRRCTEWFIIRVPDSNKPPVFDFSASISWVTTSSAVWDNLIRLPSSYTVTSLFFSRKHTLSCQSLFLREKVEQRTHSQLRCAACLNRLLFGPNYVDAQKAPHTVCRWECFSLCWGNKTDGLTFVRVLHVILQKKAQSQQAREFHKKSIKDKGVYLSGLFSDDSSAVLKVTISSLVCAPPTHLVA